MARVTEPGRGECFGRDGEFNCRYHPQFRVAGDPCCIYHLVRTVRIRMDETHGPVLVEMYDPAHQGTVPTNPPPGGDC